MLTRYAPSPTGHLHLGHVVNAIYVWGLARAAGGRVLLRMEDHDRIRCRPEYEASILDDLAWLGFAPDEGLHPLVRQSDRNDVYRDALERLRRTHHVYACDCSRTRIAGEQYDGLSAGCVCRRTTAAICCCAIAIETGRSTSRSRSTTSNSASRTSSAAKISGRQPYGNCSSGGCSAWPRPLRTCITRWS